MKNNRLYMLLLMSIFLLPLNAKPMRDLWQSMPDSMIPYLTKNQRIELVDFMDMKVKADVKNQFGEETVMDTLTSNYTSVRLNASSVMQLRLMPVPGQDSIICMVRTVLGPVAESEVLFYDQEWNKIGEQSLSAYQAQLIQKPDTMSQQRFEELKVMLHPALIKATLSIDDNSLTLDMDAPILFKDEKVQIKSIIMQMKLNWEGKSFN
jgi:hypothetical protein